ncbi:hypothetical protein [Shewanella sediminis]|nr:hypothetical protein [Shewanella sediminis]
MSLKQDCILLKSYNLFISFWLYSYLAVSYSVRGGDDDYGAGK